MQHSQQLRGKCDPDPGMHNAFEMTVLAFLTVPSSDSSGQRIECPGPAGAFEAAVQPLWTNSGMCCHTHSHSSRAERGSYTVYNSLYH